MFELTLTRGPVVTVERLVFRRTYAGLIQGTPTRELNQSFLEHLVEEAKEGAALPVRAFLPTAKEGTWLPKVACIADLEAKVTTAQGEGQCGSWLRIVWLQDSDEGLPRPPQALVDEIVWERDAQNFDY